MPAPCIAGAHPTRPADANASPNWTRSVSPGGDLTRQAEVDVLPRDLDLFQPVVAERGEAAQHPGDELLGRRGTRGHPDDLVAVEQLRIEAALAVDQLRRRGCSLRYLDQRPRVRARLRADHEDQGGATAGHGLDRVLAVLGRVADVVRCGPLQAAEARAQ